MDELKVEQDLVRALLRDQHPDLADLELRDASGGCDNQQWRLGEELAVRLPRTEQTSALLRTEHTWLPLLAKRLPLPTPTPVRIGKPSSLFELTWTIARWVEGESADHAPITRIEAAEILAGFLRALHHQAPADAPTNPTRGIPPAALHRVDDRFEVIADYADADAARKVWEQAVAASAWQGPPLWLHGDLHPANVVVRDGMLAGVIDFGEMCAGDPAADLSAAWILLPAGAASRFFDSYERADEATITRARGWAVLRALDLIGIGQKARLGLLGGKPAWEPAGYATLERVLTAN
ncbi:aminoglycoside phosphotransferase family protein [Streptomyces sp. NPDC094032]|uniref:aminoglycoside phosphotransferase family protein n=1 Tax=Streptomyces sp. NPDC094032 TaxID=3155308 RepID=UPI003328E86E